LGRVEGFGRKQTPKSNPRRKTARFGSVQRQGIEVKVEGRKEGLRKEQIESARHTEIFLHSGMKTTSPNENIEYRGQGGVARERRS